VLLVGSVLVQPSGADPVVTYIPLPTPAWQALSFGPGGRLWFGIDNPWRGDGRRFGDVSSHGKESVFHFRTPAGPQDSALGPDGRIWFTEFGGKVAAVRSDGSYTEFDVGRHTKPIGIAAGDDGNLWIAQSKGNEIGRVSTSGTVTEFPIPGPGSRPVGIASGPGGMWFTLSWGHRVGIISPTGDIRLFLLPKGYKAGSITRGPDGNMWFSIDRSGSPLYEGMQIGRITPDGVITEFDLPTPEYRVPMFIAPGPDGNVWFTTVATHIDSITPTGDIHEYELDRSAGDLTLGPDGAIWFVSTNSIGRLVP
jgi:virginiamycin B lyase